MSRGPDQWYVRARGRVLGPFNQPQLASLRDRGRLSEDDEVSHDRRSWMKASEVPGIYARPAAMQRQAQSSPSDQAEWPVVALSEDPDLVRVQAATGGDLVWFVARGDSHQGPVSHSDVQRWIKTGEIGPTTLVWKQGMPAWLPASQVSELEMDAAAAARAAGTSPYVYLPRTSGLAVASLVFALLWLCGLGSLLATISGAMARSRISRSNGALTGKSLAVLGLVLGIAGLISTFAAAIVFALIRMSAANR